MRPRKSLGLITARKLPEIGPMIPSRPKTRSAALFWTPRDCEVRSDLRSRPTKQPKVLHRLPGGGERAGRAPRNFRHGEALRIFQYGPNIGAEGGAHQNSVAIPRVTTKSAMAIREN